MFRVGQPLNVDTMEHFPSPLCCHLQHRGILQGNANSATIQQKQGWQEEGMLETDFNKSCYKTLRPVHKGELRSHSLLWRWELGSPDEVQSLRLSFAVCHPHLTIHSGALFSFLSFYILPSLLTHQCYPKAVFSCITGSTPFSSQTLIILSQVFASPKLKSNPKIQWEKIFWSQNKNISANQGQVPMNKKS